ncbi:MAG: caspase family protein [Elusimicrobia bacterium]|nr:caspase family protein [Elusimicrobiota bacterium]
MNRPFVSRTVSACAAAALAALAPGASAAEDGRPALTVQKGHAAPVQSLAVTADGRYAVSSANDNAIKLWDLASGQEVATAKVRAYGKIAATPDSRYVVTDELALLEIPTLREVRRIDRCKPFAPAPAAQVSADGRIVVSLAGRRGKRCAFGGEQGQDALQAFDLATGAESRRFEVKSLISGLDGVRVAVSPDGRSIAAEGMTADAKPGTDAFSTLVVYDAATGRVRWSKPLEDGVVSELAVSPDNAYLAVAGEGGHLFDLGTGVKVGSLPGIVNALAFSPDGRHLVAAGHDKTVTLWSVPGLRKERSMAGHQGGINALAVTPDGKTALTGGEDRTIKVWDLETGRERRTMGGRAGAVQAVAFSPDGKRLVFGGEDGVAKVWDLAAGAEAFKLAGHEGPVVAVAVGPDGKTVVTGSKDKTARAWDMSSGKPVHVLRGHGLAVAGVAVTADGRRILTAGGDQIAYEGAGTLKVWDAASGELAWQVPDATKNGVASISLSPDGTSAALGREDGSAEVWDLGARRKTRSLPDKECGRQRRQVFFSPDRRHLLLAGCYRLDILETESWKVRFTTVSVNGRFAFLPKGAQALELAGDDGLNVRDIPSFELARSFRARCAETTAAAVSPDGRLAAVGCTDGTVRLHDLATGSELLALVSIDKGWVAATPQGFFDGSEEGLKAITWTAGAASYPLEAFSEGYFAPGLVARVLSGRKLGSAKLPDLSKGFAQPPTAAIESPRDGADLDAETVEVVVAAADQGGGIDEVRLYHNGKAVGGEGRDIRVAAKEGALKERFQVRLAAGENVLRAVALSRDRIEGPPHEVRATYRGPSKGSVLHIVAVGVNSYKNGALDLRYARGDAEGVAGFFAAASSRLFKEAKVHPLYDAAATRQGILAKLKELESASPQDAAVIYLAGHGDTVEDTWYFVPHEVVYPEDPAELSAKAISSKELQERIRGIGAKKVLVLVDACKSGGALVAWAGRGLEERRALSQLARAAGVYVVAAAGKEQSAAEVKDLGHGVFTYAVLEALKGAADGSPKDGVVTVGELLSYVESVLPEVSLKYRSQAQYPVKYAGGMDFPLSTP